MTGFTITNQKLLRKGSLVGSFTLQLPSGLIIHGAMLFEKAGKRWIGFPSQKYSKPDGTASYTTILEFGSREIAERFQALVLPLVIKAFDEAEAAPAVDARTGLERTQGREGRGNDLRF
jgi:hypothetical protein